MTMFIGVIMAVVSPNVSFKILLPYSRSCGHGSSTFRNCYSTRVKTTTSGVILMGLNTSSTSLHWILASISSSVKLGYLDLWE